MIFSDLNTDNSALRSGSPAQNPQENIENLLENADETYEQLQEMLNNSIQENDLRIDINSMNDQVIDIRNQAQVIPANAL